MLSEVIWISIFVVVDGVFLSVCRDVGLASFCGTADCSFIEEEEGEPLALLVDDAVAVAVAVMVAMLAAIELRVDGILLLDARRRDGLCEQVKVDPSSGRSRCWSCCRRMVQKEGMKGDELVDASTWGLFELLGMCLCGNITVRSPAWWID